jgi:hypothetical protein
VEDICLRDGFELAPDQRARVLHDVVRSYGMDRESVGLSSLKASRICLFLFCGPRCVRNVPDILDNAEKYCVEDLNGCIFCGIES